MKSAGLRVFPALFFALVSLAQNLSTQSLLSQGKEYSFTIPADQPWTDTGLELGSGEMVRISEVVPAICESPVATGNTANQALPVPSAPAGSLVAKLHAENTKPLVVAAGAELPVAESSHLFLGPNGGHCTGSFRVKLQVETATSTDAGQASQAQTLKQKLGNAAQIWLQGQLGGSGTTTAGGATGKENATHVPGSAQALTVSDAPLDAALRKNLDALPRRVNDQDKNQGDMVNFVLIGSEKDMGSTLQASDWHLADTNKTKAVLNAALDTYQQKDYLAMPMSTLYLFGRPQDFGYEQAEPIAMVASRHHFRLWKAPFDWNGGTVWVGAGTHDIGFAKDQRNGNVTHKIDPNVDAERTNIGQSLEKSGRVKSMSYYLPANPVKEAKVATGDSYHSDGRILVVFLK